MDPLPTPHPANDSKPKVIKATTTKMATTEPQNQFRQNRVFGTARSINIIEKPISNKTTMTKPKNYVLRKQSKPIKTSTKPPFDTSTKIEPNDKKKSPENNVNRKSDALLIPQQRQGEKPIIQSYSEEKDCLEPKTPLDHIVRTNKAKVAAPTPFYTAVHCSKCRFDRLETSSYWIGQIKMAESVGKHFVAADFFRLAFLSQAEPIRNLRMELKRYLLRNEYLWEQKEWREVAATYGLLLKLETTNNNNTTSHDSSSNTCTTNNNIINDIVENLTGIKTTPD